MTENICGEEEGEKEYTPEKILEGEVSFGFAEYPLTPEEIERIIRRLKEKGINPDIAPVIRKILKKRFNPSSRDNREIGSLVSFCKTHKIPYAADFNKEELEELEYIHRGYMAGLYL